MSEVIQGSERTSSSVKVTTRTERTWQTCCLHMLIRPFRHHVGQPDKVWPAGSQQLKAPSSTKKKCDVVERKVEDIWLYDLTLKTRSTKSERHNERKSTYRIYYFNGGGWQSPAGSSHWKFLTALLEAIPHTTVTLVSYPLAPNSPAPISLPQLVKLYEVLMKESASKGETVTFAGDSSGGEIVLCIPLEALRSGLDIPKPHSIMAICPSTDLSRENPIIHEVEKRDPILQVKFVKQTAEKWAGDWDKKDPRISPLRANDLDLFLRNGIFVDGCTAGNDVLGPDGVLFRAKLAKNGVEGEWLQWEKMMHCWPIAKSYGISPESEEAFQWIAAVLRKRSERNREADLSIESKNTEESPIGKEK